MEACAIAKSIITRPTNSEALESATRVAYTMPEPGDIEAKWALIGAVKGEMIERLGEIDRLDDIIDETLWACRKL